MLSRRSHRMRRARIVGGLTACHRATWKRWGRRAEIGGRRAEGGGKCTTLWCCGRVVCGAVVQLPYVRACVLLFVFVLPLVARV